MTDTQTNEQRWGAAMAEHFDNDWNTLKRFLIQGGIRIDPAPLINAMRSADGAAAKDVFNAVLATIDAGTKHQYDTASAKISAAGGHIEDLEKQAGLQREQINILQNQVKDRDTLLANANSNKPNIASPYPRQVRRTVADPTAFSGKGNALQRQNDYQNWRSTLLSAFLIDNACFEMELKKILYACALLTGDAQERYRDYVSIIQSSPTDTTAWKFKSVTQLFEDMDRVYITANKKLEATAKLANLVMGQNKPF
jgi:hypothetical protein